MHFGVYNSFSGLSYAELIECTAYSCPHLWHIESWLLPTRNRRFFSMRFMIHFKIIRLKTSDSRVFVEWYETTSVVCCQMLKEFFGG